MSQIIDMSKGNILVASDIQGNWEDYQRIRTMFLNLKNQGKTDILVLDGDLIHGYKGYEDRSVQILDDLISNADPSVICLMGNHELMHIYHMQVSKNGQSFVEPFEDQIKHNREHYMNFIKSMPYAIRTAGGVLINHTGANIPMAGYSGEEYGQLARADGFRLINNLNHDKMLEQLKKATREVMEKQYGQKLADDFFDDYSPEIGQIFMETDIGQYLWDVFFNKNEFEYKKQYPVILDKFMQTMSTGLPQRFLISGHIEVPEGYAIISGKQLRICSSYGTREKNKVLALVDASREYSSINKLVADLQPLN